ncbi:hypothetical protein [Mesorhizobium sp.]|uniref:hypothetical protein n=1 Tax=Mesorhizobium sp. TaxID=1871066 RepID=UPI00120476B9|nr:hypothetical protein [Mesorhizobium sp.]TIO04095.1 MAG: hypothetical protein E5X88_33305 [Mesorhizobium sp.]TIO29336.1 MAG: hypothetical protein E5X89_31235 [Mesorhizobium sp.]
MAFITDKTWTPSTYRKAYALWAANAPKHDGKILPREAKTTRARHDKLSGKLKSLMTWKRATEPDDPLATSWLRYDLHADNDNNFDEHDEPSPQLLDTVSEIRPNENELRREFEPKVWKKKDVEYHRGVAIGGDVEWGTAIGPIHVASETSGERAPRRTYRIVKRIRGLEFSNGDQVERCTVLKFDKPVRGEVPMPTGSLVRYRQGKTWRRPSDEFRGAKGEPPEIESTVGMGNNNPGSLPCPDPIIDREWAADIRKLVGKDTASVLDKALDAANFKEIGIAFGRQGKNAERHGKKLVVDACEKLDAILAANDNGYRKAA